ncbi:MAG: hypothetical protein IIA45_06610 [Bacteroidetes bacterium]|nr:hypothetical protein [Bacteroidota bacterium]
MKTLNMILTIGLLSFSMITKGQWNQVSGFSNDLLHATHFTDTNTGYIACDRGMIIKTQNGGLSWDTVQTLFNFSWFLDIHFPSTNTGYACGGTAFGPHKNVVVKTTNAGLSWDSLTANDFGGYGFSTLFFVNDSIGFIAGDTVIKTTDGGSSFSPIAISPDISDYRSIHFPSDSIGYIAGFIFTGNKNIAQIQKYDFLLVVQVI